MKNKTIEKSLIKEEEKKIIDNDDDEDEDEDAMIISTGRLKISFET
jgi:hypothetical protein